MVSWNSCTRERMFTMCLNVIFLSKQRSFTATSKPRITLLLNFPFIEEITLEIGFGEAAVFELLTGEKSVASYFSLILFLEANFVEEVKQCKHFWT